MDLQSREFDRFASLLGNPRAKAFSVAVLILIIVVMLQVGKLNQKTPYCELLTGCQLGQIDLQRIQIALSQSGLAEFEMRDNQLVVPKAKHAEYLQAIAQHDVIPADLRGDQTSPAVANPFLSRSQQLAHEREAKKKQIQSMVIRLPFVEAAWLEMDLPESRSVFQQAQQSAVISIRPVHQMTLMDQQVDTVRQMIAGAIAGLDVNQVVVIDLSTGYAYRDRDSVRLKPGEKPGGAQQAAFARQQSLENRIRAALSHFPGLRIAVRIEVQEAVHQLARHGTTIPSVDRIPSVATAGANGRAAIYQTDGPRIGSESSSIDQTSEIESVASSSAVEKISILIDVPQELLLSVYGEPSKDRSSTSPSDVYKDVQSEAVIAQQFEQLKQEIERIVRPLLPPDPQLATGLPITFNLLPVGDPPPNPWGERIRVFAENNWPSIAVLLIGVVLISLITQSGRKINNDWKVAPPINEADDIASRCDSSIDEKRTEAEIRLSRLIEKDADAAAKVIENWIRDAA
jgi:hypothetical protein